MVIVQEDFGVADERILSAVEHHGNTLKESLEAASLIYMDYIVENKMILFPHKWFDEGRVFLRSKLDLKERNEIMSLFTEQITNREEWGDIFQSVPAFTPLVEHILIKENLPLTQIENLTPGTNAVFKVGGYVIKIFAPSESGIDQSLDLQTELFATSRANHLGISAPKLITHGFIEDKYRFAYMITEYIHGMELEEAVKAMTDCEKTAIARKLRFIIDKMNTPCKPFNDVDVLNDKGRYRRWDKYPECFKTERLAYIKSHDYGEKVFVHGDLCLDNILLTPQGELYIIDFADAVLAPRIYEHALLAYAFNFDFALLQGYFDDYSSDEFIEMCFNGLLIHDFGGDIAEEIIGNTSEFQGLEDLRKGLKQRLEALLT